MRVFDAHMAKVRKSDFSRPGAGAPRTGFSDRHDTRSRMGEVAPTGDAGARLHEPLATAGESRCPRLRRIRTSPAIFRRPGAWAAHADQERLTEAVRGPLRMANSPRTIRTGKCLSEIPRLLTLPPHATFTVPVRVGPSVSYLDGPTSLLSWAWRDASCETLAERIERPTSVTRCDRAVSAAEAGNPVADRIPEIALTVRQKGLGQSLPESNALQCGDGEGR